MIPCSVCVCVVRHACSASQSSVRWHVELTDGFMFQSSAFGHHGCQSCYPPHVCSNVAGPGIKARGSAVFTCYLVGLCLPVVKSQLAPLLADDCSVSGQHRLQVEIVLCFVQWCCSSPAALGGALGRCVQGPGICSVSGTMQQFEQPSCEFARGEGILDVCKWRAYFGRCACRCTHLVW